MPTKKAAKKKSAATSVLTDCKVAQLSPESLSLVANFFKVLSESNRLQIVCSLKSGPLNVTEIIEATGLGQANVSKHLKMLTQAGVVSRQPRGVSAYYEISNQSFFQLCEIVCETLSIQLDQQTQQIKELISASPK